MKLKERYSLWLLPENLLRVQGWALDGLIDEEIANKMEISKHTFYVWKKRFPAFDKALKLSKEVADRQIEQSLFKLAKDGNITAQIFWLKNRKPREWRDKQELEVSGETKVIVKEE